MKLLRSFKTELDPNNVQKTLLCKSADVARFAYNWGLARRIEEYKTTGKSSGAFDQNKQLVALKHSTLPWLKEVLKDAPQYALRDLDSAYQNFFRRVKNGENPGFPKFKAKHKTVRSFSMQFFSVIDTHILIPRIGLVRLKEHRYLPITLGKEQGHTKIENGKLLRATIKQSGGGRWFITIQAEITVPDSKPLTVEQSKPVGVDLGLKSFAVLSDGRVIEHPKFLKKKQRKLKRLQRAKDRKVKGSCNRHKAIKRLSIAHYRVACARREFLHYESSKLVKTKPVLVFEDLNIRGMQKNHLFAGAIADSGWGEFVRLCTYKTQWAGGSVTKADQFFPSSKLCSSCGWKHSDLKLSNRVFICGGCGNVIDRDLNAARNLSKYVPSDRRKLTPAESVVCKKPRRSRNYLKQPEVLVSCGG